MSVQSQLRGSSVTSAAQEKRWAASALDETPFPYNETVAKMMASMAQLAFCGDCVTDWTCAESSNISIVSGTSRRISVPFGGDPTAIQLVIAKLTGPAPLTDMCLLSFHGTSGTVASILDAAAVGMAVPDDWDCQGCNVHAGWGSEWVKADPIVAGNLTDIGCDSSPLAITGHSMGGALATLAAWTLKVKHHFTLGLFYNFESPRVLFETLAQRWEDSIGQKIPSFRITHDQDPVVHVPPRELGYEFAPRAEVYYSSTQDYTVCAALEACGVLDWQNCRCSQRHNLAKSLLHVDQHCGDHGDYPLVPNGNICTC